MSRFTKLQDESGSALVAALLILMVISMLGVVMAQGADVQTHQTGHESAGEQAFTVAESALNAEASLLAATWPSTTASAFPVCTQASTGGGNCPQGSLAQGYSSTYAGSGYSSPTWSVQIIDDNVTGKADANYYSDQILTDANLAHYDSNLDNKLWIRADATINGQHRIVVASIGRQSNVVQLPQSVITSGGVFTSNNGNKVIIEAKDPNSGLTGSVDLRCGNGSTTPTYGDPCAGWDPNHGQLDPPSAFTGGGYQDPSTTYQTLSDGQIEALRQAAQAAGTYFPAGQCPLYGATGLLFIEDDTSNPCRYTGAAGVNWGSDASPVAIVVAKGTLEFGANVNFYGVIYLANEQGTAPTPPATCSAAQQNVVFTVDGGGAIHGGLFIDRCGTVNAGDKAFDIVYDTKAFGGISTYATPSLALNTFKIVNNS